MGFHIVPENIQRPHVSQQMPESPMKKHVSEQRIYLVEPGKMPGHLVNRVLGRYQSIEIIKGLTGRSRLGLKQPGQQIDTHQSIRDHRNTIGHLVVPDGYH
jgi:hypothetical protein